MNQQEVVKALEESRKQFLGALEGLDENDFTEPGVVGAWSIKDVLYHLTMWESEMVKLLWQASQGQEPSTAQLSGEDPDALNSAWAIQGADRALETIMEDFHSVGKQAIRRVNELQKEDFEDPERFSWLDNQPLWTWIAQDSFNHEKEHSEQILAWRAARSA